MAAGETKNRTPVARDIRARRPGLDRRLLFGRLRRVLSALSLVVIDVTGLALALYAALVVQRVYRDLPVLPGVLWRDGLVPYLPFTALVVVGVFAWSGLYRTREERPGGATVTSSLALSTLIVALFALAVGEEYRTYSIFWVTFVFAAIGISLLRASYDSIALGLMRALGMARTTLVVGHASAIGSVEAAIRTSTRGPDIKLVGAITHDGSDAGLPGVETVGGIDDLPAALERLRPADLVMSGVELPERAMLDLVERCRTQGTRLRLVPTTAELLFHRMTYVPGQSVPLFEVRPPVFSGVDWVVKRGFDLVVSLLLLVILSPLMALVALAVRLTSPGAVIYRDMRIGVGESEFAMLKFRSMYKDAQDRQAELESLNEADGAIFKIRDDPRVTSVGRIIRRLSLDELPQLVNVLRGEMSLVGPRPLPLRDAALLEDWHRKRYLVLPGITGLWQTSGRSSLNFDDLVRLDFYYIENWSLWLDIAILLRTPLAVAAGRGAY